MTLKHKPIYAGQCVVMTEYLWPEGSSGVRSSYLGTAGVRIMSPSAGGEEAAFVPASDVYLGIRAADAQALSAYFAALSRELLGAA